MALATTTLSSALTKGAKELVVASATSFAAGRLVRIDGEFMKVAKEYVSGTTIPVSRGLQGSAQVAHVASAQVTHGDPADWASPGPGQFSLATHSESVVEVSYSAAGAIELPTRPREVVKVTLLGTAIAMTIADPDEAINGARLFVTATDGAAHTLTSASSFAGGGGSYDVLTFDGTGQAGIWLTAQDTKWVVDSQVDGTITSFAATVS